MTTYFILLAMAALAYKLWTAGWNCYYRMLVTGSESSISQKLEVLASPIIKSKFTFGSEVGVVLYDSNLSRALVALNKCHVMLEQNNWKGAYKALDEARSTVSRYNLGHLPPRDMPRPRALA